ncbi:MAG TPA: alcohol dehydrogenase catalytic domain-containing protein [Pirellulaceae bacterium]|nr:alcohol dehydrogenase catalytic domain-containing protein [Pirellulaceae bacterium]HMO93275.1 alcohol dehydrogenase catalytic domain-containing protein [Pirellulaceae bacterium]HMP70185.1 alcohol dehydrogenase catalytic domain-containing protein [Pirellulaceae bacterium]
MKAIVFLDPQKVAVEEIDDPRIEHPADAIVQVESAGLCGSDLHVYYGRETGIDVPTALGHEFVGRVVEVGPDVKEFSIGDRVSAPFTTNCGNCFYCLTGLTCRCEHGQLFGWRQAGIGLHGGQAQFVRVPMADATLVSVGNLSSDLAILFGDNLSTGFFCADLAGISPGGVYVVIGCGAVGLISVLAALEKGAKQVFAVDMLRHRREHAIAFGATQASDPCEIKDLVLSASQGRGADAVLELVGLPDAQQLAFDLLRPGGTIATIGCHCERHFAFSPVQAYDKNLTYRTGRCPARFYMDQLKESTCQGKFDRLKSLVSHRFQLQDGVRAYDVFANRQDNCLKAVLDFG